MKKRRTERAERRARERASGKLADAREKLSRLEPGGAPERPIDVVSASVIESRARAEACLRCGREVRAVEHRAETVEGRRLRVVKTTCPHCNASRVWYFRLGAELPS
jgi:hypothetical protein